MKDTLTSPLKLKLASETRSCQQSQSRLRLFLMTTPVVCADCGITMPQAICMSSIKRATLAPLIWASLNNSGSNIVRNIISSEAYSSTPKLVLRMNSKYGKTGTMKRSPSDFLKGERNYYCPCDEFNLFEQGVLSTRDSYCQTSMSQCVEK